MFQAVRQFANRFGTTFRNHRAQRTARLFLFEFVVVLLGVLAAQMLQAWASTRQSRQDAGLAYAQLQGNIANLKAIAAFWDRSAPCLVDRVRKIAKAASTGERLPGAAIGRPALPTPEFTDWTDATRAAVERRYGAQVVADHAAVGQQAGIMLSYNQEIASEWATFALLDQRLGSPSAEDRANVRLAAAMVWTQLKMERIKVRELKRLASRFTVPADQEATAEYREIADDCGVLRDW